MKNQKDRLTLPATDSIPGPGEFPVRSIESRAAARRRVQASVEGRVRKTMLWIDFEKEVDGKPKARIGEWIENLDGSLMRIVVAPSVMDEEDTLEIFGTKKNPLQGQMGLYGIEQ
jgi:hypothetical protein